MKKNSKSGNSIKKMDLGSKLLLISMTTFLVTVTALVIALAVFDSADGKDGTVIPVILLAAAVIESLVSVFIAEVRFFSSELERRRRSAYHRYVLHCAREEKQAIPYKSFRTLVLEGIVDEFEPFFGHRRPAVSRVRSNAAGAHNAPANR